MKPIDMGFNPNDREAVSCIINNPEDQSFDGYEGTNIDGDKVLVFIQYGECMIIKTRHKSKPNW